MALYVIIALLVVLQWCGGSPAPTNLLTTRVGPCTKVKGKLPVAVSEMSIYTRIYDSSVTGRFNVTEPIKNGWRVKATMQKCQDIRNLATCDPFRSYTLVRSGCLPNTTMEDEDLYGMLFHHTTPRIACPVKPGKYKVMGYPFFTEDNYRTVSEAKISTSMFGYTYKIEGFFGNRLLLCVEAFMQLVYVREHNRDAPIGDEADAGNDGDTDAGNDGDADAGNDGDTNAGNGGNDDEDEDNDNNEDV